MDKLVNNSLKTFNGVSVPLMRVVRRNFLAIISGSLLSVFGQGVQAATGPTLKATKLGQKIVFQGYTYTTIKLKGKLVWKKGAKIVKGSPSATPTAEPTHSASAASTSNILIWIGLGVVSLFVCISGYYFHNSTCASTKASDYASIP